MAKTQTKKSKQINKTSFNSVKVCLFLYPKTRKKGGVRCNALQYLQVLSGRQRAFGLLLHPKGTQLHSIQGEC